MLGEERASPSSPPLLHPVKFTASLRASKSLHIGFQSSFLLLMLPSADLDLQIGRSKMALIGATYVSSTFCSYVY